MLNLFAFYLRMASALHLGAVLVSCVCFEWCQAGCIETVCLYSIMKAIKNGHAEDLPLMRRLKGGAEAEEWNLQLCHLTRSFTWNVSVLAVYRCIEYSQVYFFSAHADAVDLSDTMAPVIVIPPQNTSVVAGSSEITLECVANARYCKSSGVISN